MFWNQFPFPLPKTLLLQVSLLYLVLAIALFIWSLSSGYKHALIFPILKNKTHQKGSHPHKTNKKKKTKQKKKDSRSYSNQQESRLESKDFQGVEEDLELVMYREWG